ncbi:putative bifunctional diguanylate cyclase/phosphodiesterase [Agrilutibacter solisilvae]|uniref:EAL domain-containing protein n=1 Tax=Agrilutibacter solisilvae TaxID=2763317 RepID=A0A975AR59_9GAMM|nr:GGDEF domain-containing protein [Lysobacter solisilvae]QSX77584.1 EAL domain-containing protein [Lysobacter solisilvae]
MDDYVALQQLPSPATDALDDTVATGNGRPGSSASGSHGPNDPACEFADLVKMAAQLLDCPIALIAVAEAEHFRTAAEFGYGRSSVPREHAICRAINATHPLLFVADARQDARFRDDPVVTCLHGVRFYLGIALMGGNGRVLGVLSVADRHPRDSVDAEQLAMLQRLARVSARLIERRALDRDEGLARQRVHALFNAVVVSDRTGTIVSLNSAARQLFGAAPQPGTPLQALFPADLQDDPDGTTVWLCAPEGARTELDDSRELRLRRPSGRLHTVEAVRCAWEHGDQDALALILRDTTDDRRLEQARVPQQDPLTGTPNRATLMAMLDGLVDEGAPFVIGLLGLDSFRNINDALGHAIGDAVLQIVACRLLARMPAAAQLARFGGDEFAMVFPHCAPDEIDSQMQLLLRDLARPCQVDHHRIHLEASIGLARIDATPSGAHCTSGERMDAGEVLARAGLAMRRAKRTGGKQSRWFEPAMRTEAIDRRKLDLELRRACLQGEFELHYQPQIDLASGHPTGAEALLRWRHPERGLLFPVAFIEALSHSVVAQEVGRWIMQQACRDAAAWPVIEGRRLAVGVNLFPVQLDDTHLLEEVDRALSLSGLDPALLELELTETIALRNDGVTEQLLARLRARGIRVSFDDFGTGYASLSMLQRLPVDRVKIDRSFVQNVIGSRGDEAIVRSIALIARNFDLTVIAEGVETDSQASLLREIGCDQVQGFLYSRALSAEDFNQWLDGQSSRPAGSD